jgi:hypothetical protein
VTLSNGLRTPSPGTTLAQIAADMREAADVIEEQRKTIEQLERQNCALSASMGDLEAVLHDEIERRGM